MDYAPYNLVSVNDKEQAEEDAVLQNEEASSLDAVFVALAAQPEALSESSRFLAYTQGPFVQEDTREQQPVSQDDGDPLAARRSNNGAASAEHVLSAPPNNIANSNPQNLAGAYAGAGQGPGGVSTPNPSGGAPSGGGGSTDLHLPSPTQVTQLQQALSGSNAAVNPANANPTPAATPNTERHDAAPQAPNLPGPGILVHSRSGPIIGDPTISATEGVEWYGAFPISDSDSDDSSQQGQSDTISGSIDWGDGSSTPFSITVPEGGSFNLDPGHTWMETGTYTVTITANDPDSGTSQVSETATVADGQLSWSTAADAAPNSPPSWGQSFEAAPSITAPANQTNTEGDTVNLQVQASDSDGDTLSYDALDLPPGLSINSSTGLISGTVAYGAAEDFGGSYTPTIIVADGHGGSNQASFSWTINQAQVAPVLTTPSDQTNLRGDSVSLQVNATQVDNDPIVYEATNLPPGLSIDPDTGVISGTVDPSSTLGTPYAVTVTTTDENTNLSTSQTFNWTISAANVAPVLTSPGNQTNSAGDDVSLQLSATDADGNPLTYTATGLPPGLTLDPIAGTITGTLPNSAASSTPYNVTVTASDGMASSSQSFTWTVNAVSLPNPGDQSNLDGDSVSLQLTASDANNATLTYSANNLPPGLSIDGSTGLISGTISSTADTNSPYSVTVTATDSNNNSVSQSFNWTVARLALNNPGDQENQEGTSVSLQLSASDNEAAPTYSATGLPSGLSISSSGLISGTLGTATHGSSPYQVTVTAADGSNTSSQSFVWTVTPRVALVNPGPQSNAVGNIVSLQLSATSPGGAMTYSASGLPPGLNITISGLISGTPTTASSTPYNVTVTANDGTSSSSQSFSWTVSVINLVSPGDQTNNDGDTVSLSLTTGYHGSGTLSYSANNSLPPGLSINSSTGQITGTISGTADTNSPYSVTVTVTDGTNTSSQTFNWTVNPVVSIAPIDDQNNAAGDSVSLQVTAGDTLNNTLTYSATGLPSGLTISSTSGLISGKIAVGDDANSPYAVTVTATDSAGNSASQSFNWTVAHVSLINPGPQSSIDGANVSLQLQGGDADGDTVSYTASGLPSGLGINTSTGLISGTIASNADANSPYAVTVTAKDTNGNSTTQTFLWTVSQVALSLPSNQTNTEGDNVSLQLQGAASSGSLSYNASGLPAGLSLNTTSGLISGTLAPGAAANGPYTVDVSVTNGTVSTSQTLSWAVNPVVNLTAPADQSNVEGNSVSLQVSATDSLGNSLTFTASNLPTGLSISSSGLISGTISSGDSANSPYVVMVTASDGTYSSSATFTWTVTHTDTTALTMTNPGTQVNVTGDSVNLPINASDPDGIDTLIYSATGLPDGLDIDPFTGIIAGTVADDAASTTPYSVTVTADDGNGQSVSQTFNMLVNASPLTATASAISAVEGNDTGSITVATFTTADLNSQAGDFTAAINYGDGTTDIGTVSGSNGSFTVTDDHTYAETGSYAVSIIITDTITGASATATTTATVADAALTLTGGLQLGDPMTDVQSNFILASFTDANPVASTSDFTETINWGDGTTSTGNSYAASEGNGVFLIGAAHGYPPLSPATAGPVTYTVTVTVTDVDGASASTTSTVVVGKIASGVPATMSGWVFVDQNGYASASDFIYNGQPGQALINWGDGTISTGTVSGGPGNGSGPVQFSITAPHTYTQDSYDQSGGQYPISVTVTDDDGNTLSGSQDVSVVRPPMAGNGNEIEVQSGLAVVNVQMAEFTVPDGMDGASEFSATIIWGDGNSSSGTIQEVSPGLFEVLGSHTYSSYGGYTFQVEVNQDWQQAAVGGIFDGFFLFPGESKRILGPKVVPGNSTFIYQIANLPVGAKISSWSVTDLIGPSPVRAEKYIGGNKTQLLVSFKNISSRVDFTVHYDIPRTGFTTDTYGFASGWVDVISIIALNHSPTFKPSTPMDAGARTGFGNVPLKSVRSGLLQNIPEPRPNLPPGMQWSSFVVLNGPDDNENVNHIHFGFIQYIHFNAKAGLYDGGNRRVGNMQGHFYLDSKGSIKPWYPTETPEGLFFEVTPENNSMVINSNDNPEFGVPWDYEQLWPGNPGVNAGALHYLREVNILATFYTWVAAQTIDAPSDYWGEAYGKWTFNARSTVNQVETPPDPKKNMFSLAWVGLTPPPGEARTPENAAGVYAPGGWSNIGYSFPLNTGLPLTNDALNQEKFE